MEDNGGRVNSVELSMARCISQIPGIHSDQRYIDNKDAIVRNMASIWAALTVKPASMLEWAKNVYKLYI